LKLNCTIYIFLKMLKLAGKWCLRSIRVLRPGCWRCCGCWVYLCTYWRHSVKIWLTDNSVPQIVHIGFSFFAIRYLCVSRVCPMRNLFIIITFSFLFVRVSVNFLFYRNKNIICMFEITTKRFILFRVIESEKYNGSFKRVLV
jgi:hypothetical protein